MPKYSFQCKKCGENFSVNVPWEEKEKAACPQCGSLDKSSDYSSVGLMTGAACPTRKAGGVCPSSGSP